jgi:hypothetical protein
MPIMKALQAIKNAVLAFHRWFMKYSGMTMIIDNVEERRRGRQNEDPLDEDSGSSSDSPLHKQEMGTFTRTTADEDSTPGSSGAVSGSTEGNKKVLG